MNWDSPEERYRLAERVGHEEYNRLFDEHIAASTVACVNGYRIRPITTERWGRLYQIDGAGLAFRTLDEARSRAVTLAAKAVLP